MDSRRTNCTVCNSSAYGQKYDSGQVQFFVCPRCGRFSYILSIGPDIATLSVAQKTSLSYIIRKNQVSGKKNDYKITEETLNNLPLIMPFDQADYLILYLGNHQNTPGENLKIDESKKPLMYAEIGISVEKPDEGFKYIVDELMKEKFVEFPDNQTGFPRRLKLTFKGWKQYENLKKTINDSKVAFMAMKFPPKRKKNIKHPYIELELAYKAFQIEVKKIGFNLLNPLLEIPKAGSIDARLEHEIRAAKFLVADLTHDNQGVYWESGLAHGLGKKVFYTCKEGIKTHFDINHHTTIYWKPGKEQEAAEKLKNVIQVTILD